MASRFSHIGLVLSLFSVASCTWLDHPTSPSLQQELRDRSAGGLALARVLKDSSALEVRFFDGRKKVLALNCCRFFVGGVISRNRIALVDISSGPVLPDALLGGKSLQVIASSFGGPVVVMDAAGFVLARSAISIRSSIVAVSPSGDRFAFVGAVRGHPQSEEGIYVAGFEEQQPRKLVNIPANYDPSNPAMRLAIDWSSDGRSVLFSCDGKIVRLDAQTGQAHNIAVGGAGQWSPSGDWISYVSMESEPMLMNVITNASRAIDPGRGTGSPIEWSPDGKYLLIYETRGGHVPYGCLWVYRIADGAFVPVPFYGAGNPRPHWVHLAEHTQ